mmetsp:Transcript_28833/g.57647  ORF Transcript_28833/g.57647 Transcript_28833/m.57647 type:complete len:232 (-) Transcript_28833:374-1069(-)
MLQHGVSHLAEERLALEGGLVRCQVPDLDHLGLEPFHLALQRPGLFGRLGKALLLLEDVQLRLLHTQLSPFLYFALFVSQILPQAADGLFVPPVLLLLFPRELCHPRRQLKNLSFPFVMLPLGLLVRPLGDTRPPLEVLAPGTSLLQSDFQRLAPRAQDVHLGLSCPQVHLVESGAQRCQVRRHQQLPRRCRGQRGGVMLRATEVHFELADLLPLKLGERPCLGPGQGPSL